MDGGRDSYGIAKAVHKLSLLCWWWGSRGAGIERETGRQNGRQ